MTRPVLEQPVAVAWASFQPRTVALANALGGAPVFLIRGVSQRLPLAPRYSAAALRTWQSLERKRPAYVVVIATPCLPVWRPTFGAVFASVRWSSIATRTPFMPIAGWARVLHPWLLRRSRAALVHTEEALLLVR